MYITIYYTIYVNIMYSILIIYIYNNNNNFLFHKLEKSKECKIVHCLNKYNFS